MSQKMFTDAQKNRLVQELLDSEVDSDAPGEGLRFYIRHYVETLTEQEFVNHWLEYVEHDFRNYIGDEREE
jgi:hypothetical protein